MKGIEYTITDLKETPSDQLLVTVASAGPRPNTLLATEAELCDVFHVRAAEAPATPRERLDWLREKLRDRASFPRVAADAQVAFDARLRAARRPRLPARLQTALYEAARFDAFVRPRLQESRNLGDPGPDCELVSPNDRLDPHAVVLLVAPHGWVLRADQSARGGITLLEVGDRATAAGRGGVLAVPFGVARGVVRERRSVGLLRSSHGAPALDFEKGGFAQAVLRSERLWSRNAASLGVLEHIHWFDPELVPAAHEPDVERLRRLFVLFARGIDARSPDDREREYDVALQGAVERELRDDGGWRISARSFHLAVCESGADQARARTYAIWRRLAEDVLARRLHPDLLARVVI